MKSSPSWQFYGHLSYTRPGGNEGRKESEMKTFENLLPSEIQKAEKAANMFFGRSDCKVTGYSATRCPLKGCGNWYDVLCEICFGYVERAEQDVLVSVFMDDRRRSFATVFPGYAVLKA